VTRFPGDLQLLEVAISNVMAAPVRNSIELDAVGELHLVLFFEPGPFLCALLFLSLPALLAGLTSRDVGVIGKLELLGVPVEGYERGVVD
jgi:hypothetical protein